MPCCSIPAAAELDDLNVRIECRDGDGQRRPDRDIELEIYRSGDEINLMLSWWISPIGPCSGMAAIPYGWMENQGNAARRHRMRQRWKGWPPAAFGATSGR